MATVFTTTWIQGVGTLKGVSGCKSNFGVVSFNARVEDGGNCGCPDRAYVRVFSADGTTVLLISGDMSNPDMWSQFRFPRATFQSGKLTAAMAAMAARVLMITTITVKATITITTAKAGITMVRVAIATTTAVKAGTRVVTKAEIRAERVVTIGAESVEIRAAKAGLRRQRQQG